MTQIINIENALYQHNEKANKHKAFLLKSIPNIVGPLLLIGTLALIIRSKHKVSAYIAYALNLGKIIALNYFKRQIIYLLKHSK